MQTEELLDNDFTIAVSFRHNAKAYEFRCNHLNLRVGDQCIVDTERGPDFGVVTRARIKAAGRRCHRRLKNVIRKATDKDLMRDELNQKSEREIYRLAREKISESELKMKASYVEITFDEKRAIIYYTSEARVDFRDLVKSIASEIEVKIEMRKLGIRDEAKFMGGCGVCGQELCCSAFLSEFAPVSIRMAKDQNLSLNNSKISGVCGRLMCCLVYENDFYKEARKTMGSTGKMVDTPDGQGRIVIADYLRERLTVDLGDGVRKIFDAADVTRSFPPQRQKSDSNRNRKKPNGKAVPPAVKPPEVEPRVAKPDNKQADKEPQ